MTSSTCRKLTKYIPGIAMAKYYAMKLYEMYFKLRKKTSRTCRVQQRAEHIQYMLMSVVSWMSMANLLSLLQSPFSLPWQKVIWQNFAIWLWQFEKPKPRPQVLRSPILSENCGFYVYFLVKSWGINVKLINNLPKLIKGYYFFKKRLIFKF